ncbi:hypothetical protein C0584_04975 [Candidatus Parcubacteria bacterium]|nr:MAG: hypothetical protein C0584_04975 [Candidatus Parcubacteria bacterium]
MSKTKFAKIFVTFLFLVSTFLLGSFIFGEAQAQEETCDKATLRVIARNDLGEYIPGIKFDIYKVAYDADQNQKPGSKVTGGTIDSVLGYKEVSFVPTEGEYVLKMWDKNSNSGAFWFFNDISLACGAEEELTEYLSGFNFVLRDSSGELRKDSKVTLYTQRYDVDGEPIKERQDLVASLNTSSEGEAKIYVADSSHFLDDVDGGSYVFVSPGLNGGEFIHYDLVTSDGATEEFEYIFSDIEFYVEDEYGIPFPANTKVEIYKQAYDHDGEEILGDKVKDVYTDDKGFAFFEYPEDIYAVRVKNGSGDYQNFWEIEMVDRERTRVELIVEGEWQDGVGACEASSKVNIETRNFNGEYVPNISFELYEQITDIDGEIKIGNKAVSGKVNELGKGVATFNPDPRKTYIIKMWDKNANIGDFWFYDDTKFFCGEDINIVKDLSSITFVLRDADGNLLKNHSFSLYTQSFDIDGNALREKKDLLSSSLNTGAEGELRIYVSGPNNYDEGKNGKYIFSSKNAAKVEFTSYNLDVSNYSDLKFEYIFSDLVLKIKDALSQPVEGLELEIYKQERSENGDKILGTLVTKKKTDINGWVKYEYPEGTYAVRFKDSLGKYFTYWDVKIKDRDRNVKELKKNLIRITPKGSAGNIMAEGTTVNIYSMIADDDGQHYYQSKTLKSLKTGAKGYLDVSLVSDVYLFTYKDKEEYGVASETLNGAFHDIELRKVPENEIVDGRKFVVVRSESSATGSGGLADKLKGHILLQVENNGEAWYVDHESRKRYYMRDGGVAYQMMRDFGLGISNENLKKIPIGFDDRFEDMDYDGDGLPDKMEEALGTDMYDSDTDIDGYKDGEEVMNGYNPLGPGKLPQDLGLAEKLKGQILLQVESRGEAWYVNPTDGKRYYMKDGDSAYNIMRFLSLGITNEDLNKIEEGELIE